ncbi:MAG: ribonuclease, partial [Desulfomicrobiaceae bacterium]|nr:ribonuclease [Desulfomicrobiaceae bacterium]
MGEIMTALVWIAIGAAGGFFLKKHLLEQEMDGAQQMAARILDEAKKEALAQKKEILVQAEAEALARKKEAEQDAKDRERELKKSEARLQAKEERLEQKVEQLAQRESELGMLEKKLVKQEKELEAKEHRLSELVAEQQRKLEEISGLTAEEAKNRFMQEVESKARHEAARMIRQIEVEAQETAHRKAQMIIATAVQRYASDYVAEHTVSAVELPSEDMKGRIIGREGRNIRALEAATGVDLIIDDTPETVVLSAF